jgi:hypothetical protein
MAQNKIHEVTQVPQDVAVWIVDLVQIQALSEKKSPSREDLNLINESATRCLSILEGRLTPELMARMSAVAREMAPLSIKPPRTMVDTSE